MPVTLDVSHEFSQQLSQGEHIALRDPEGVLIAVMIVGDIWEPDRSRVQVQYCLVIPPLGRDCPGGSLACSEVHDGRVVCSLVCQTWSAEAGVLRSVDGSVSCRAGLLPHRKGNSGLDRCFGQ